ncbi:MAG TPA: ATP-binding protein [Polyangiaceae bacterium]|nr:ATP-binding protein [Polyangiaceae bacterium]
MVWLTTKFRARLARVLREFGRIRYRLLAVNLFIVLVPAAGLEFARVYERQLLEGLERDMENQASLVRVALELRGSLDLENKVELKELEQWLERAARGTRTRVRVVHASLGVVLDSHSHGPPEGPRFDPPRLTAFAHSRLASEVARASSFPTSIQERSELRAAFSGKRATATRVARKPPAVYLFLADPILREGKVWAAVYVTRSTEPVLVELHRIRRGLLIVLAVALAIGAGTTLLLAWTISRPLERLASAARRIASGAVEVDLPSSGGGEISALSRAFGEMTRKLHERHRYISEFAADVAHGFKSPLTSIRGAAELLNEGAAQEPEARDRFLGNIVQDAERLDRLVSRLLQLSRIDSADTLPAWIELDALVKRVLRRFDRADAPVHLLQNSSIPVLYAREGDLEIALGNLLDNAQRHAPPGSPIELRVSGRPSDGKVTFSVRDTGAGIAPEHLPHIFDRFFTTDSEGQGTGLGLSIVKSVALAHGGQISVFSVPGQGARFDLCIPVAPSNLVGLRS